MDLETHLIFESYGGVCGCPGLWSVEGTFEPEKEQVRALFHPHHQLSFQQLSPSSPTRPRFPTPPMEPKHDIIYPTPPGAPNETCFFWYHNECRHGDQCHKPHKIHITWPIPPPPEYVHLKPCHLPLCPIKDSMQVLLQEAFKNGNDSGEEIRKVVGIDSRVLPKANAGVATTMQTSDDAVRPSSISCDPNITPSSLSSVASIPSRKSHRDQLFPIHGTMDDALLEYRQPMDQRKNAIEQWRSHKEHLEEDASIPGHIVEAQKQTTKRRSRKPKPRRRTKRRFNAMQENVVEANVNKALTGEKRKISEPSSQMRRTEAKHVK